MNGKPDFESWERDLFEALRPIDPNGRFWVRYLEMDFTKSSQEQMDAFPYADFVPAVDEWLDTLPDELAEVEYFEWEDPSVGVRLKLRAQSRTKMAKGWGAMPSLTHLEQPMDDLRFAGGDNRQFISLSLDEVDSFADGEALPENVPAKSVWVFTEIAKAMRHFDCKLVIELDPASITVFAGMLGLVDPPPELGPI